uniref:Phosphotransferase n=1 Tax=Schizaphis graminum TaxID=13262 RepID=A0A2S2NCX2_SCHGA
MLPNVTAAAVRNVCQTAAARVVGHICGIRRHTSNYSQMFRKRLNAEQVGRKFEVPDDELKDVARRMSDTMDLGLRRSGRPAGGSATIKCWNTRVPFPTPSTATGAVARQFLSVELSHGRRFSTRMTTLLGTDDVSIKSREHPLTPSALTTGRVADLFDCVAGGLAEFAHEFGVRQAGLPLAFTFGFPVGNTGALGGSANLHRWTKEFDFVDGVSRDVVAEWRMAAARADLSVASVAVLNDACAAMIHGVAEKPDTRAAVVVDDGCNCCYVSEFGRTVINTEWGAFGEDGALDHLLTEYDRQLDARSRNPGQQIYEKMTSGKLRSGELHYRDHEITQLT